MAFYTLDESVLIISNCQTEKELSRIGYTLETYKRFFSLHECDVLITTIQVQLDIIRLLNRLK